MGNGRDISKDKLGRSLLGDAVASGLVAASPYGAGTASAWCASAGGITLGKKESTMLKKLVVGAIAAGVLAVPLAGVAGADPDPATNPGVPGNFPGGIAPGQRVSQVATAPKTVRPPGTSVNDIAQSESDANGEHFANVGDAVNDFAPGHNK
jgi:hypothetical protein